MKLIAILLFLVLASEVMAQSNVNRQQADTYIPRTLSAGTLMSARTGSTSLDDTTQYFSTRGFSKVYVGIETAANDSVRALVSFQPSKDGVNFSAFVLFDSLNSSGTVGVIKYFALPDNAMGAEGVRVRIYSNADLNKWSSAPSTTVTTKIIRKHY